MDTAFGIISVHMMGVYDALYDVQDRFRFISARHEQAAAYEADGYARGHGQTGRVLHEHRTGRRQPRSARWARRGRRRRPCCR